MALSGRLPGKWLFIRFGGLSRVDGLLKRRSSGGWNGISQTSGRTLAPVNAAADCTVSVGDSLHKSFFVGAV